MGRPRKERRSTARSRRKDVAQDEPNILALCTAHFGGTKPSSAVAPRQSPPREVQRQTRTGERRKSPKKTKTTTGGPLRDPQTSVSSREIALDWKAAYRARCCSPTPRRPRQGPKDRARALGFHFAVGPGVAGIGSWLGASYYSSPLAPQFAGVGLLAALRGEPSPPPSPRSYRQRPLRYTPPPPRSTSASSLSSDEETQPGTGGEERMARPELYTPLKRLAAFDAPTPTPTDDGPSTCELAALLAAAPPDSGGGRRSDSSPPPPNLVPDDTGSEAEDEATPRDASPQPQARPVISLCTAPTPAAQPHPYEPVTPTSPSPVLETHEMDVDEEPGARRVTRASVAQKAVLRTPARRRAAKPAFGLMTPPPSVGRL